MAGSTMMLDTISDSKTNEIEYQLLKQSLHQQLVDSLDVLAAKDADDESLRSQLTNFIDQLIDKCNSSQSIDESVCNRLREELPAELFGLGPLEPLMDDAEVADILVNHPHEVFIERRGRLEPSDVVFANEEHLLRIIRRIAASIGRRIDEVSPMVDARLADGSRVNAVIAPLALDGPKLSIRRFGHGHLSLEKLVEVDMLSQAMADYLASQVRNRRSIMIAGGTGAGKTTLLNAVSACVPKHERIVTIEDAAELKLQHPHVARLETRPANSEGAGQFSQRDLVRNALRMRPDRIFIGEVRGDEALDMLQAMNTGHEGSLTTIHANDTRDAISRLEMMVAMTGLELPVKVVRAYISAGIHVVVHLSRLECGTRRVMKISELEKSFDGDIRIRDLFEFQSKTEETTKNSVGDYVDLREDA
jgi:pilus assembly protein CpaF